MFKDRQFRFQALTLAVVYSDGFLDCLKAQGKVELEAEYHVCYIDMGKDIRIVLIDKKMKTDYTDLPIVLVARENISEDEWNAISEIRFSGKDTAN